MVEDAARVFGETMQEGKESNLAVQVSFLIPEDTFSAITFQGSIVRCNERGMLVTIDEVPSDFYRKLLAEKRFLKILMNMGSAEKVHKITGLVSWLDFHRKGSQGLLNVGFEYVNALSKEGFISPMV